mmetsp:Transcript_31056/g.26532  ORF Transcript_31056/g.26532 Transcript_31056/m.26532 type:complete len:89 (-) Transcript_31056:276-542(-)
MVFVEGVERPLTVQEFSRPEMFKESRPSMNENCTSVSTTPDLAPVDFDDCDSIELLSLLFALSNDVDTNSSDFLGNPFHVNEHVLFDY